VSRSPLSPATCLRTSAGCDIDPPFEASRGAGGRRDLSARTPVTVVCLLSSPHSGSTVLGTVLASDPSVQFAGELFEIPIPAWWPGRPCACGLAAPQCEFWERVVRRVEAEGPLADLARREARYGRWRALPGWWIRGRRVAPEAKAYARQLEGVIRAISAESGRPIVIDSSKIVARAMALDLRDSSEFRVRFVHLVRNGQDVLRSRRERRKRVESPETYRPRRWDNLRYPFRWLLANWLIARSFARRRERYLALRYEEFLQNPAATLERLGRFLDLDLSDVARRIESSEPFPAGHVIAGNRLRSAGSVVVQRSAAPTRGSPAPSEPASRRLAAWVARLFGYRWSEPDPPR
jgi:hypothetical protein